MVSYRIVSNICYLNGEKGVHHIMKPRPIHEWADAGCRDDRSIYFWFCIFGVLGYPQIPLLQVI